MRRTSKPCHHYQCGLSRRPHRVGTSVIKAERASDGGRGGKGEIKDTG